MKTLLLLTITILSSTFGITQTAVAQQQTIELTYALLSEQKKIGNITAKHAFYTENNQPFEQLNVNTQVETSGWWGAWVLGLKSRYVFSETGLQRFDHRVSENKKSYYIMGEQQEDMLWTMASEVKTQQQIEDDAFFNMTLAFASEVLPGGEFLGLLGSNETQAGVKIAMDSFDSTLEKLPSYVHQQGYQLSNKTVYFLNTDELQVSAYELNSIKKERLSLAQHDFDCHVITAETSKKKAHYWIAEIQGKPFVIKEEGEDSDGPYEMVLQKFQIN